MHCKDRARYRISETKIPTFIPKPKTNSKLSCIIAREHKPVYHKMRIADYKTEDIQKDIQHLPSTSQKTYPIRYSQVAGDRTLTIR